MPPAKKSPPVVVTPELLSSRNYSADLTAAKKQLDEKPGYESALAVQRARLNLIKSVSILRRKIRSIKNACTCGTTGQQTKACKCGNCEVGPKANSEGRTTT